MNDLKAIDFRIEFSEFSLFKMKKNYRTFQVRFYAELSFISVNTTIIEQLFTRMEIRATSMEYMGVNSTEVSEGCRSVEFSILVKNSLSVEFSLLQEFYTLSHTIPHCSALFRTVPLFFTDFSKKIEFLKMYFVFFNTVHDIVYERYIAHYRA